MYFIKRLMYRLSKEILEEPFHYFLLLSHDNSRSKYPTLTKRIQLINETILQTGIICNFFLRMFFYEYMTYLCERRWKLTQVKQKLNNIENNI